MADIPGQIEHLVQEDRLTRPVWYEWLLGFYRSFSAFKSNAEGAWTAFTPTYTSSTGGPPVVTSLCRYRRTGKTIEVGYDFTLTNLVGGTGFLFVTLPVPTTRYVSLIGSEGAISAKTVNIRGVGNVPLTVTYYDNTSTLVINARVIANGVYEVI